MTAMAARQLGYRVFVLDPRTHCSAAGVVDGVVAASFDDAAAAARLAVQSDVVTLEIEKIGAEAARAVQARVPMRPSPEVLGIIRDRKVQRTWLADQNFPQAVRKRKSNSGT